MSAFLNYAFSIVAILLLGVVAAFLVLLNNIKDKEEKEENNENGKINK